MVFQKNHLAGSILKGEYPLYAHVISIYIIIYIYAPLYPLWSDRHLKIHRIVPSWYSIESHSIIYSQRICHCIIHYVYIYIYIIYIYILLDLSSIWNSVVSDVHHSPVIFFHHMFRLQSFRQRCRQLRSLNGDVHGEMVDVSIEVNGFHYGS